MSNLTSCLSKKDWHLLQCQPFYYFNFFVFISTYINISNLSNYWFLPQQFLYFLPLPQVLSLLIYIVYIVFIVLFVFQGFHGQVTIYIYSIYSIYFIISIYLLRTICEHCSQYFILLINGSWT